jgi:DNA polymerase-4
MAGNVKYKAIIHLDMDAFYPAVEAMDNPALKGKPIIVGGIGKRGVVSSASYEARKFGVHSAQPMATARRLCAHGVFLPVRMARYKEISRKIFEIFYRFTPLIEPLSIDEAFLDVTGSNRLFGDPVSITKEIKKTVSDETGLTVSAGVATNKFIAKIASEMDKPDGLTIVPPEKVREFLDPLPIRKMWGVGKATHEILSRLNIHTFKDMRTMPVRILEQKFGKHGLKMHELAMGIDERDVILDQELKSIGNEKTFSEDICDIESVKKEILALSGKVAHRMRKEGVEGKTITLKVRYGDFSLKTRSITLNTLTNDGILIYKSVCRLLESTEAGKRPVRLLGVSLSQLHAPSGPKQLSLFDKINGLNKKRKDLNITLDLLQEKFGNNIVHPGTLINKNTTH